MEPSLPPPPRAAVVHYAVPAAAHAPAVWRSPSLGLLWGCPATHRLFHDADAVVVPEGWVCPQSRRLIPPARAGGGAYTGRSRYAYDCPLCGRMARIVHIAAVGAGVGAPGGAAVGAGTDAGAMVVGGGAAAARTFFFRCAACGWDSRAAGAVAPTADALVASEAAAERTCPAALAVAAAVTAARRRPSAADADVAPTSTVTTTSTAPAATAATAATKAADTAESPTLEAFMAAVAAREVAMFAPPSATRQATAAPSETPPPPPLHVADPSTVSTAAQRRRAAAASASAATTAALRPPRRRLAPRLQRNSPYSGRCVARLAAGSPTEYDILMGAALFFPTIRVTVAPPTTVDSANGTETASQSPRPPPDAVATVMVVNPMVYAMDVTLAPILPSAVAASAAPDGWAVTAVADLPPSGVTITAPPAAGEPPVGGAAWARDDPATATLPPIDTAHPRGGHVVVAVPLLAVAVTATRAASFPAGSAVAAASQGASGGCDGDGGGGVRFSLAVGLRCVDGADGDDMAAPWSCRVDVTAPAIEGAVGGGGDDGDSGGS
ncbi:hypothetical protein MMPV_002428 [Pyropia vietnamensis]